MRSIALLKDGKMILRQAFAAWFVLTASVIAFIVVALLLSPIIGNREQIVAFTFLLILPFLAAIYVFLQKRNYYFTIHDSSIQKEAMSMSKYSRLSTEELRQRIH